MLNRIWLLSITTLWHKEVIESLVCILIFTKDDFVATDDAPSCEVPSRRRTIKPPAWQKDYYMF